MKNLEVKKTYKIYIDGAFPRTESGRYYALYDTAKNCIANICLSSRKDIRNAVVAARKAQSGWWGKTAYNRSQILYRIAEMLEGRKSQLIDEMCLMGLTKNIAIKEVSMAIDTIIYYCGWCDKYQQIYSSVNPVAGTYFNFSVTEPTGVVGILAPENSPLQGLVASILPAIAGGNTCVVLASDSLPLCAVTFAEILATSDMPSGVVNILTGKSKELHTHFASHMDINALVNTRDNNTEHVQMAALSAQNVKRYFDWSKKDWYDAKQRNPYMILDLQEIKTTWHPIENIGISGAKY